MRFALELAYDGTTFCGWQNQPNGISVQQTIEESLSTILRNKIEIVGCGRTDTGVHAQQYFAHFDTAIALPQNILYNLNALLGKSIAIKNIHAVADEWHARFDANKRTYQYFIHQQKNPFQENYSFLFSNEINIELMNDVAKHLIGTHDFTSFEKKGSDNKNSICTVFESNFSVHNNNIIFRISANRFLRNMVRAITSSLLMVGTNKISKDAWIDIFQQQITMPLKVVVPAKGLFLWEVQYHTTEENK
jgi:tRNA pseudouridine38-40 synthase